MASNLKRLQDRGAAIAARMQELRDVPERSDEQNVELRKLGDESDAVRADLEFEGKIAAKEAELRSVLDKGAPAPDTPAPEATKPVEVRQVLPTHTSLRCFNDGPQAVDAAYRTGRWLRAAILRNDSDIRWCREHGVETRALNEGSNSAGGALVPEEFSSRVIRLVEEYGTFPPAAENVSMSRDTLVIPKRVTGTTAYWIGEGSSITESEPTYQNVNMVAKKLACSCRMSSEVAEDTLGVISMADAVGQEFATDLAYRLDIAGWLGDGTSTYGGIRGIVTKIDNGEHTASVHTALAGNGAFETFDIEDFLGVIGKLPIYARGGAAWYISPAGFAASIARIKYAAGGVTLADRGGPAGETFLGYPVRLVHVMNSILGADVSKIKVLFGNMAQSSIYARRREFSVKLFDQVYATSDQLLLQGTMRCDINHHSLGSTSEVGPVVALKSSSTNT